MTRVVITGGGTGGHLLPALALAHAIRTLSPDVEPVLVGAARGLEARLLPTRPFRYHLLATEPLYRHQWWRNVRLPFVASRVLRAADRVLATERPSVVLGTGGYAAAPVLFRAWRRRIPIVLQEQNAYPGIATRLFARIAREVHLGYPEARSFLVPGKGTSVVESGNPIIPPPDPRPDPADARQALGVPPERPVLFVFGGSQGARRLNEVLADLISSGRLDSVTLLWSTGQVTWDRFRAHDRPPARLVRPFWDPIAQAYAATDLAVARAGAMTTAELCAWGLPSVLVPLPTAAADHQTMNARALERAGAAVLIPEAELTTERLARTVEAVLQDPVRRGRMGVAAARRRHPKAAETIARSVLSLVS
jgi:UDP-N-acetylglucosamine--N-acetylmuramyl-(pentapeptide) pyrophosphoryl-undecaprenol N-acetylglucosamine transferase